MNIVDYHHHVIPEGVADMIPGTVTEESWDPEQSLRFFRRNHIDTAVVSLCHPNLPVDPSFLIVDRRPLFEMLR